MTIEELAEEKRAELAKIVKRLPEIGAELNAGLKTHTEAFVLKLEDVGLAEDFAALQASLSKLANNAQRMTNILKARASGLKTTITELDAAVAAEAKNGAARPDLAIVKGEGEGEGESLPAGDTEE